MARLLHRVTNQTDRCLAQRPSRDDFHGLNHDSIQAVGLQAWWPLWEPMANSQLCPPAMDHSLNQLDMRPSVQTKHLPDPQMGTCWWGQYKTSATGTGDKSWMSHSRLYANGVASRVDPVDFGALPGGTVLSTAYMSTSWVKSDLPATTVQGGNPPDMYVYAFDRNDGFGFPGHAMTMFMRMINNGTTVSEASASIYDNDSFGQVPFPVMSLQPVNDGIWHLMCGIYVPTGFHSSGAYGDGIQVIAVDGEVGFIGGVDDAQFGLSMRFGRSEKQCNMGSPQDAGHASTGNVAQYIGSDDDGLSSPFAGWLSDHRLYSYDWLVPRTNPLDIIDFALQQSRAMYHPETRWELYRSRTPKGSSQAIVQTGATDTCHLVTTGGWVY